MRTQLVLLCSLAAIGACSQPTAGELRIVDPSGYAPITAQAPGVAYFTLQNNSNVAVRIDSIGSYLFADAEVHETRMQNGQSRMREVTDLVIDAGDSQSLQPGGMHVMLMQPRAPVSAGAIDTLTIRYNTHHSVVAEVTLRDRLDATGDQE